MLRKPSLPDAETLRRRIPARVLDVARAVEEAGGECYLVGGWVRDAMLGVPSKDLDVEVHRLSAEALWSLLERFGRPSAVGRSFGIVLMRIGGEEIDFALPRTERRVGRSHRDFDVDVDPWMGFARASARRDFTVNAMGLRLPSMELRDPHGGARDLAEGVLRHVGPAFGEDPLRALRGAQFAARFGMAIAPETVEVCAEQELGDLSVERIDGEFRKMLLRADRPSVGLEALKAMRQLRAFPELDLPGERWRAALEFCDRAAARRDALPEPERTALMFCALCSELAPEEARSLLARITRDLTAAETALARLELLPELREFARAPEAAGAADEAAGRFGRPWVRRLALRTPIPTALALLSALPGAGPVPGAEKRLETLAAAAGVLQGPPVPLLQGRDLVSLGIAPGPAMGELLKRAFELQLDEKLENHEKALEWAKFNVSELGNIH